MAQLSKKNTTRRIRGSYVISVISITMVLFILGITGLLLINAKKLSDYAKSNINFTVFLKPDAKSSEIDRLQGILQIAKYTENTEFISKEKAAEIMEEELGKDFTTVLGYNSLPNSIEVRLKSGYASPDSISEIKKNLSKFDFIKEIYYQKTIVSLVNENVKKMSVVSFIVIALLLLIAVSLINNTIRLSVYSKRFLIKTAQLVGATRTFIRKPFVIRSIVSGVLSASLSSLVLVFLILILQENFMNIVSIQGVWLIILIIFLFGIVITGISGKFAVNKYLKTNIEDLYY